MKMIGKKTPAIRIKVRGEVFVILLQEEFPVIIGTEKEFFIICAIIYMVNTIFGKIS